MWRPSLTKLFVAHSKKQAQAAPQTSVGDPSEEERGFRVEDGRDSGPLRRTLRPPASGGLLLRRASLPTHRRCERPPADEAGVHCIERFDSEYERGGVCWVLMSFEPLGGWRELVVTERRRKREFALAMRRLAEEQYPKAEKIRVVMDNLSTHSGAAFYENFSAENARKLARRIEFCYTPVHGSWLNMVEVEISVLVRQCLKRRLPDIETLEREAKAWCTERNRVGASVHWRFRTEDARTKLRSLYPSVKV